MEKVAKEVVKEEEVVAAPVRTDLEVYGGLVEGLVMIGNSLVEIGEAESNPPIKLLVAQLTNKLGFSNPEVGDIISMIRFAVENDDLGLEKLTAHIAG